MVEASFGDDVGGDCSGTYSAMKAVISVVTQLTVVYSNYSYMFKQ